MTKFKKMLSYVLVFMMVFSSFTILPSEFFNSAIVYGVDVSVQGSDIIATEYVTQFATELETEAILDVSLEITTETPTAEATEPPTESSLENSEGSYVVGDFEYKLINNNTEVEIIAYKGKSSVLVIPNAISDSGISDIEGKTVTSIGDYAFVNNFFQK